MNHILSIYPNSRGFGFACLELGSRVIDTGLIEISPVDNEKCLARIKHFMDYFKPALVTLRDTNKLGKKGKRITKLTNAITELAIERDLPTYYYSREQVKFCFEQFGANDKYEMSQKIIEWIEEMKPLAPKKKKFYETEDYHMGVFDALSLAICYGYYDL